jgi:16S rRNA (cytosine1402-N4)-methyltransferase
MAEPDEPAHVPVLLERVVDVLEPSLSEPGAVLVDATLGLGGHAEALLRRYPGVRLIGVDRDPRALELASARLGEFGDRFRPVHAVYDQIGEVLADQGVRSAQGVLFDLGVSSLQLDDDGRGFTYSRDAPLDMRMDQTSDEPTAADVLNTYPVDSLKRILRTYGEERFASRIAREIVRVRGDRPFVTSSQLVSVLDDVIPAPARRTGGHPAKRTFQALRIEVNGELAALERALDVAIGAVSVGGRVVALSYHSLEDRLVKHAFAAGTSSSAPHGLPVELPEHRAYLRAVGRPQVASEDEVQANRRAASARMRVVERVRETSVRRGGRAKSA